MIEYFILTLNEESNILGCIESIKSVGGKKITVLDGGSIDSTRDMVVKNGTKVIFLPETSISFRRGFAINNSDSEYICFVDADQRINKLEGGGLDKIIRYFEKENKLAGIQFSLKADVSCSGYWAKGFAKRLQMITGQQGFRRVIGTPCVFRLNFAKKVGYEKSLTGPSDDTLFCSKLIDCGFTLRAIKENASELVRANFKGTIKKAFWYGLGDAEFIRFNKKRRRNHLFHVLIRGPVIYPVIVGIQNPLLLPFFLIFGFARVFGLIYGSAKRLDLTKTFS
jgi:glycosyltransferase involved in cell wall biosynthesis